MRLCGFILLFLLTCTLSTRETRPSTRPRSRRSPHERGSRHRGAHHVPLTEAQEADQNLQFMLSLYRSAAGPDGRPRQHRKFGSNTVRLLRPTASSVRYLPATRDHHYSFTVQYDLDTVPSEQLVKASFVHLRSSAPPAPGPPRCRARLSSLGSGSFVTLEPHQRWTETDITAHVLRGARAGHLTLTAQYWCSEPGREARPWWSRPLGERRADKLKEPHLEAPSLLLYLEEERDVDDWMGELLGDEGEHLLKQIRQWHPTIARRRRSRDLSENDALPPDALKEPTTTAASSSSVSTSPLSRLISDLPTYKRKTGTPKNRCKLHSFRLSFDKLGWGHYFIAPPVYNPRFCRGDCPRVLFDGFNSPHHAIIQNAMHEMGISEVPPLSCVPYKYLPLSVLVVDKKKVEYKELEDMVADSCTCR